MVIPIPFFSHDDYWNLGHKVTFDGEQKLIIIAHDITTINFGQDIYSDWKEWAQLRDNLKYEQAMSSTGGDPTVGGDALGATYFLENDWKIRTWEGDHRIIFIGNFFARDGSNPFALTIYDHNILIQQQFSNLIDKINVASDVRTELTPELSLIDASISSRASQASVDILYNALVAADASVIAGSTTTAVKTDLTHADNFFDGMYIQIVSSVGAAVRRIDEYSNTSGTIFVHDPFPFTPAVDDAVYILAAAGHKPTGGGLV